MAASRFVLPSQQFLLVRCSIATDGGADVKLGRCVCVSIVGIEIQAEFEGGCGTIEYRPVLSDQGCVLSSR